MPVNLLIFVVLLFTLNYFSRNLTTELVLNIRKVVKMQRFAYNVFALLFLPGTLIHELAHYLTAIILFVPVGKFSLKPRIEGNLLTLGSVSIGKSDPFRSTLVGIAPFVVGMGFIAVAAQFMQGESMEFWKYLLGIYVVLQASNTMFLSKSDFRETYKLLLLFTFIVVVLFIVQKEVVLFHIVSYLDVVAKTVNFYLFLPVAINFILLLVLKGLRRFVG
jgi:hypothetical protein